MADALFVYGTLMEGFPLHHLLEGRARFLGEGQIRARLFSLGAFPGAPWCVERTLLKGSPEVFAELPGDNDAQDV